MKTKYLICCTLFAVTTSCGDKASSNNIVKTDSVYTPVSITPDSSRRPVFTSLKYEDLSEFLPSAEGFSKSGEPSGESAHQGKSGNIYYSYAKQVYQKGENQYYLEIIDYKDRPEVLEGLVHMYGFDTTLNNNELTTQKIQMNAERVKALATTYKEEESAKLTLVVNNRFLINTSVTGKRDIAPLKKLAGSIKLEDLAHR